MHPYKSVLISAFAVASLFAPLAASAAGPICSVPSVDHPTIQSAVDDVTCTTINVAAGTYAEHVAIGRALILNGANVGIAGNDIRGAESVITGDATGALQITASDVTVDGFEVMSASNALGSGIHMASTQSGALIKNNLITGNQMGIYANSAGASTISYNLFDGNNESGSSGGTAIYSEYTDNLTVDHNEFKNHSVNNPVLLAMTAAGVHKDITISNNDFHDNDLTNIYALGIDGGSIAGNTIVPHAESTGISFGGANTDVAVTKNSITGGERGVRVQDEGYALGDNSAITINRNNLATNSDYGAGNPSGYTGDVDATCNWWHLHHQ